MTSEKDLVQRSPSWDVHLGTKGLPAKPGRLLQFLPIVATTGQDTILIAREEESPWTVDQRFRSH